MKEIKARSINLINGMKVVENPALIKIETIKKKYLEQITNHAVPHEETFTNDDDIIFIGLCDSQVIYSRNGKLEKIDYNDFAKYYAQEFAAMENGYDVVYSLPEIFHN